MAGYAPDCVECLQPDTAFAITELQNALRGEPPLNKRRVGTIQLQRRLKAMCEHRPNSWANRQIDIGEALTAFCQSIFV